MVACRYEANAPQLNVLEAVDAYTVGIDRPACVPSRLAPHYLTHLELACSVRLSCCCGGLCENAANSSKPNLQQS